MHGDGHEKSAAWAFASVGEGDGRQGAVRAAELGDAALVDRDRCRAQPLDVLRVELGRPVGDELLPRR